MIASDAGAVLNGNSIPPGGVHSVLAGNAVLDGVSMRNATAIATRVERASGFTMLVALPDGYKPKPVARPSPARCRRRPTRCAAR